MEADDRIQNRQRTGRPESFIKIANNPIYDSKSTRTSRMGAKVVLKLILCGESLEKLSINAEISSQVQGLLTEIAQRVNEDCPFHLAESKVLESFVAGRRSHAHHQ